MDLLTTALFISLGTGQYMKPANGTWYQEGHEYEFNNTNPTLVVGVEHKQYKLFAFYLGNYTLDAMATPDDKNYNPSTPNHCNGQCLPLSRYVTKGKTYGLAATYTFNLTNNLAIELGPTYYNQSFNLHVENQTDKVEIQPLVLPTVLDQGTYSKWALGNVVGIKYKNIGLYQYHLGNKYNGNDVWPTGVEKYLTLTVEISFK